MNDASASPPSLTEPSCISATTAAITVLGYDKCAKAPAFLKSRGLSLTTLARLPVAFGMARGRECIFFRQGPKGFKARPLDEKTFWQAPGTPQQLWNLEQCQGSKVIWITEGELDACALVEAGVEPNGVVSLFGGGKESEDANLNQAKKALEALKGVQTIILCHDADDVGFALRKTLAKVLGAARCRFVEWPEGIKDANDMLLKEGPEALYELVNDGTLEWPVDGLYRLHELPVPPPMELWDAGWPEWEGGVKLGAGHMSVATGHGGHGKTRFMAQVWWQIATTYGLRVAVCSMETMVMPGYRRYLREFYHKKSEGRLSPDDMRNADRKIEEHYRFIQHPERKPSLQWLLDVAEVAVVREGCRAIVIDPWNKLERARDPRQTETDYISEVLDGLILFAHDLNCHVQVIAHPSKRDKQRIDTAPTLEDIAGSKAWETKPDQGFALYREKTADGRRQVTDCEFIVRKTRYDELGFPRVFNMKLDLNTGCFVSTDYTTGGYAS